MQLELGSPRVRTNNVTRDKNCFGSASTSMSIGIGSPTFWPRDQLTSIAGAPRCDSPDGPRSRPAQFCCSPCCSSPAPLSRGRLACC